MGLSIITIAVKSMWKGVDGVKLRGYPRDIGSRLIYAGPGGVAYEDSSCPVVEGCLAVDILVDGTWLLEVTLGSDVSNQAYAIR